MTNPFAQPDTFEAMRSAALEGNEEFARFRRRQAADSRRHVARSVELRLSARVNRMLRLAVASSRAVLLVGPPGTGKTEILEQLIDEFDRNPQRWGFQSEDVTASWVTPEEEWTFEKIVLGETVVDGDLASLEGDLLVALRRNDWLILDETNRADMDRVLGGVLTWLSGKRVRVGSWREDGTGDLVPVYLDWADQPKSELRDVATPERLREYVGGSDWRILGTYNAVDAQRVFRMGQALGRRFKHVPVPPASIEDFRALITSHARSETLLDTLQDRVTRLYAAHFSVADAQLGPGLFVDIPAYVEHGLRHAQVDPAHEPVTGGPVIAGPTEAVSAEAISAGDLPAAEDENEMAVPVDGLDPADGAEHPVGDGDRSDTSLSAEQVSLLEELLAEAYLISVGNIIAKYEPELLDDLGSAMASESALTPQNWSWLLSSLVAMRA